jgi:hypothetical protein
VFIQIYFLQVEHFSCTVWYKTDSDMPTVSSMDNRIASFRSVIIFKGQNFVGYLNKKDEDTTIVHNPGVIERIEEILKYTNAITSNLQWKDYLNIETQKFKTDCTVTYI